jgi:hypothetical protein
MIMGGSGVRKVAASVRAAGTRRLVSTNPQARRLVAARRRCRQDKMAPSGWVDQTYPMAALVSLLNLFLYASCSTLLLVQDDG